MSGHAIFLAVGALSVCFFAVLFFAEVGGFVDSFFSVLGETLGTCMGFWGHAQSVQKMRNMRYNLRINVNFLQI